MSKITCAHENGQKQVNARVERDDTTDEKMCNKVPKQKKTKTENEKKTEKKNLEQ